MNKCVMLEIPMPYGPEPTAIHPVALRGDGHCVLVDCGFVGSLLQLEGALQANGIPPGEISHIILTHQDHDHVGAAAAFRRKYPHVRMLASAEEAPYISGARKSLRLQQAEQLHATLPADQQAFGRAFCELLRSVEPVAVDQLLKDGDTLPFCGGVQVLATPGHTPGHISLFVRGEDLLIAGDAIALEGGLPVIANPRFTLDLPKAEASMQRLLLHPAGRVICYHGGVYQKS